MKGKPKSTEWAIIKCQELTAKSMSWYLRNVITVNQSVRYDILIRKATLNMIAKTITQ
jgi:hypothetical protein